MSLFQHARWWKDILGVGCLHVIIYGMMILVIVLDNRFVKFGGSFWSFIALLCAFAASIFFNRLFVKRPILLSCVLTPLTIYFWMIGFLISGSGM